MTRYHDIFELERVADREINDLGLWRQPLRSVLSLIYLSADSHYTGRRFIRNDRIDDEVGTAMLSRLSYLMSLLGSCGREIGRDIDDALSVVDETFGKDVRQALGYAHFCEIMPSIRRGHFEVEREGCTFRLRHPSERFQSLEESDVLMSELVLAHDLTPPPYPIERCERMVKAWPHIPGDDLVHVLKGAFDHYLGNVFELPLLGDSAFQAGFGMSRSDFLRTRAALLAYADFCLGMADASERLSVRAYTRPRRQMLEREVREWAAPLLNRNHVLGLAAGLAGVSPDSVEHLCSFFTLDPDHVDQSGGGEGFFPPFLRVGDALLFSPHAVKRMMPERNLLYALNRTDRPTFDEVVSSHLEPSLVDDAASILSLLPGVQVRKNVLWGSGEIDVLAVHPETASALQIQAKAAIPPEGARMTAQIESRTTEAAKQIKRFMDLSDEERDTICSTAFDARLTGLRWSNAVLVRSCFGTEAAWGSIESVAPLNPVLLRAAVRHMANANGWNLEDIVEVCRAELHELHKKAIRGWERKSFNLLDAEIEVPLLQLDHEAIALFRNDAMKVDCQ